MRHQKQSGGRVRGLLRGAGLLTLAATALIAPITPALAQDQATTEEEIVITGSRIPRPDYASANPVVSVTGESIQYSGITNVTDFLQDVPALTGSDGTAANSGDQGFIGSTGLNLLDLRNLGTQRTLVLVNGRRHVAAVPASADVDTNTIPTDLIERVDVLTGGASAIYGADGVSGVVNFIMRDDFEGLRVRGQYGEPEEGGAENAFASVTAGINFAQDRGNIAVSLEVSHEGRLDSFERAHTRRGARIVRNPLDFQPDDDPDIFDRVALEDLRWFESGTGGAIDADFDFVADFDGNTNGPWDVGPFPDSIESFTYQLGGSGTPVAGYGRDLIGETDRAAVNLFGHYDITSQIRFYTEQKYVLTEANSIGQPTFDFFLLIDADNPFIPANIAAASGGGPLLVTRDNIDFGYRGEDITRETYRGVWGFEGDVTSWLSYNVAYVYGRVETDNVATNNRFNDRFAAALDAVIDPNTGQPTCRSNLDPTALGANVDWQGWAAPGSFTPGPNSGCVPINIFGAGSPSPQAIDWIMTDSLRKDENSQQVATAYLVGQVPGFSLPGGDVSFVVGGEWRRERASSTPSIEDQNGLTFNNVILPSEGGYEVREAFGEIELPLFTDRPLLNELTFNAAARYSDYSTFGDTTTWNYGLRWSPVPDITFRGTQAEAVRVPNIGELFDPISQTFAFIDDPCDSTRLADGTEFRAANCAALLTALGAPQPYTDQSFGANLSGRQGGNTGLTAETAETITFGVIVQPRFIEGLTVSLDYYDIKILDAINVLAAEDVANQCVDLPTLDNRFCDLIIRESGGAEAGAIVDFLVRPENVAEFATSGIDFSVRYLLDPARFGWSDNIGTFAFNLVGNHLDTLEFINLPGADADPDLGEINAPEWQVNFDLTWSIGDFILNYGYNYFSETDRFDNVLREAQPDDLIDPSLLKYEARSTHDLQARWNVNDAFSIYGGVNNLFNQEPDDFSESYPVSAVGRYFYIGFTASVDSLTR